LNVEEAYLFIFCWVSLLVDSYVAWAEQADTNTIQHNMTQ